MFSLFIFAATLVVSYGVPLETNTKPLGNRIIGGESTTIDKYPYQLQLQYQGITYCGAVIISPNVALTTGRCIDATINHLPNYNKTVAIRAGSSYVNKEGSIHKISKTIIHEDFVIPPEDGRKVTLNDIGLIFVQTPFEFDSSRQPIALRRSTEEIESGMMTITTGFGITSSSEFIFPDQLQVVDLPYVSKNDCKQTYSKRWDINEDMICAGNLKVGGKGICACDLGGPLVYNGELIGISADSLSCALPEYPSIFTEVSRFYDWIVKNAELSA